MQNEDDRAAVVMKTGRLRRRLLEGPACEVTVREFEQKVLEELSALKIQMNQLMGIGQPGRLHLLESRVECHERTMQRIKGLVGAFGGTLTLVQLALAYLGGRRN